MLLQYLVYFLHYVYSQVAFNKVTQPKELTCPPPPPQNCMPQKLIGIPFDTISTIANSSGYYLKIEPK